jgi:hypothetical protein
VYFAFFALSTSDCSGFIPYLEFGCAGGGELSIIDAFSSTDYLPICFPHFTLGDSYRECTHAYDAIDFGDIVSVGIAFSCSGSTTSQLVGEALSHAQVLECSTNFITFAGNGVSLAFYNTVLEEFDTDSSCLSGEEDERGACVARDTCSILIDFETCPVNPNFLPAVHVIQDTPLTTTAVVSEPLCTLCYNGLDAAGGADFPLVFTESTCGDRAVNLLLAPMEMNSDACLAVQASAYYLCGCPQLPPRRTDPYCSVCANDENKIDFDLVSELNIGGATFRPITCGALDTFLSYTADFTNVPDIEPHICNGILATAQLQWHICNGTFTQSRKSQGAHTACCHFGTFQNFSVKIAGESM